LDVVLRARDRAFDNLMELAEKEKQAQLLVMELISTRRRVNVLEHIVIPELGEQIKYIYRKLDKAERDNISRLMKIADMIRG
jgi:V/A-type H+-transporting ATPase subunit D